MFFRKKKVDYHENAKNNSKPSKFKTILFHLNSNCKKTIRNLNLMTLGL